MDPVWIDSMQKEIAALESNNTWTLCSLPPGKSVVRCAWKYKVKLNPDGTVDKPKSRVVAQGFTQVAGIDFHDCFSPVAKWTKIWVLIHLAAVNRWHIHHIDVNNAFLHGFLHEEIFIRLSEGYTKALPGQVCKLNKSLYGPKQASREWNAEFTMKLLAYGFIQSEHDHYLFTQQKQ